MADNTKTLVQWSYLDPDDGDGDGDGTGIGDGEGSISLELSDKYDVIGFCEGARRVIKAIVDPADLNYKATITQGTITPTGTRKTENFSETFTVREREEYDTRENLSNMTASWVGDVISMEGDIFTTPPSITIEGSVLKFGAKVGYGNVKVQGERAYVEHIAEIYYADLEDEEAAIAVFAWSGGVEDIEVKMPSMTCKTEVDPDDEHYTCYKRTVTVDPCTGEIISDETNRISCDEATHTSCSKREDT